MVIIDSYMHKKYMNQIDKQLQVCNFFKIKEINFPKVYKKKYGQMPRFNAYLLFPKLLHVCGMMLSSILLYLNYSINFNF